MPRKVKRPSIPPRTSLAELIGNLSHKRQEIIRPVVESPREFVLLSVRSLASRLKSDPATIVRVVRGMGFSGYREFQRFLHDLSIAHATSLDLMRASSARDSSIPTHVRESLEQESRNLQALRNTLEFRRVEALARRVYAAKRILLIGGDLASTLVDYLEYHLTVLGLTVLTATTPGRVAHTSRNVGRGDLVFAISFRRGLRLTVEGMQQASARGAYCVGITDTFVSPVARFADECFLASVETPSFGASYVAPIALLDVLLVGLANYRRGRTLALLKQAETEQRLGFRWYED
ncbi:MAG TPA: MurR/RpiR family transcriptional regulator [Candidatus Acidoferrum sp.]|nr:MurR/RpiR family transcriptional regulator [Candidatus Acidoferrum sp.]